MGRPISDTGAYDAILGMVGQVNQGLGDVHKKLDESIKETAKINLAVEVMKLHVEDKHAHCKADEPGGPACPALIKVEEHIETVKEERKQRKSDRRWIITTLIAAASVLGAGFYRVVAWLSSKMG